MLKNSIMMVLSCIAMSQPKAMFAQAPDTIWSYRYNGTGNGDDAAYGCIINDTLAFYVVGSTFNSSTGNDYISLKIDAVTGDTVWLRFYNGPVNGHDNAYSCALDACGNLIVTGQSYNGSNYDYLTIKYDGASGDTIWTRRYNGASNGTDVAYGCAVDSADCIYVMGRSFGRGNFCTIKYNSAGDTVWSRAYGPGNGSYGAQGGVADSGQFLYVTGYMDNGTNYEYCTIKYNSITGDTVWSRRFDNGTLTGNDYARACAIDCEGKLYVTGNTYNGSNNDYTTIKYDPGSGDTIWVRRFNGPAAQNETAYGCITDRAGGIYITGASNNGSNSDALTIKYDTETGDTLWTCRYNVPSTRDQQARACGMDPFGHLYIAGFYDNGTNNDLLAIKYGVCTGIPENLFVGITAKILIFDEIFPNPISDKAYLRYTLAKDCFVRLMIYDIAGRKAETRMMGQQMAGTYNRLWQNNSLPTGVYFCHLMAEGQRAVKRIIIVR